VSGEKRFPFPALDQLPSDLQERIDAVVSKIGFVPNVFKLMARRPDEFRAFFAYHDALMEKESGLSKAEREMIVVATSAANSCPYCVVAHGAVLRIRAKDPLIADQVAVNYRTAPVDERQRVMLEVAVKLARSPELMESTDLERLRDRGFSDEDIWDIGAIVGLFALSNRMAHLADLKPNAEFYGMGR
jgi:uncharacterized peroxidase-related enzyme